MANGTILFEASGYLQGKVEWSSSSNGSSANTSTVVATLYARRTNNYTTTGQSWSGNVKIGSAQQNISFSTSVSVSQNWVQMATLTTTVSHNNDGTGSVNISGTVTGPQGTALAGNTSSGNQTVTLDKIARKSSVKCADGNIGDATTINITRADNSFKHTLTYSFPNNPGTGITAVTGTIATKTSETEIPWTIPTSFYAKIPNDNRGEGTITCETFDGNTSIGTTTCTFKANVVDSNPTITATIVDSNSTTTALTGDNNKLVKYFSNALVTMTATAKNSATIVSKKVTCGDGKSATTSPATLNAVESGTFNLSCTDSRGNPGTNTITKTMVEYIKLAITNLTIQRASSTSNTINISLNGNYFNSSFGSVANTLSLKWRYRLKGGTWENYTTVTATKSGNTFSYTGTLGTSFDYQSEYEFEVVAQDKLITDTKTKQVTAGVPLIDIYKDNVQVDGTINATRINSTHIKLNDEPNGKTWRSLYFGPNATGSQSVRKNDGILHYSLNGTTSALGESYLQLGNGTAQGTAGNKRGTLRLYGTGTYYVQFRPDTVTAHRTITLPNKTGTVALTSDIVQKSCMTICNSDRFYLLCNTAYEFINIPLDASIGSIGSNLEFVTNGIKIKKNMTALISGQIATWNSIASSEFNLNIARNGSVDRLATGFSHTREGGQIQHHVITPMTVSLNTNDIIYLCFNASSTGQYNFLGDSKATYLTVQEL